MSEPHDTAVRELLEIQQEQRAAHLGADPDRLVALFAADFVQIGAGSISRPSAAESRAHFQRYFDRVTFLAWDDVAPPEIRVSDDASLATVIVGKRIHLYYQDEAGIAMEEETIFAWQETYVRRDGRWQLAVVVSTNAPRTQRPYHPAQ